MSREIIAVRGTVIPFRGDDTDTDQIVPARYLVETTFANMGNYLFADARKQDPNHPLNNEVYAGAKIGLTGTNFGCGSSWQHAPEAMARWGLEALIGHSFAEIFFGNWTRMGHAAVGVEKDHLDQLYQLIEQHPETELCVDLSEMIVYDTTEGGLAVPCTLKASVRESLMGGTWDPKAVLRENIPKVRETAQKLPYWTGYRA